MDHDDHFVDRAVPAPRPLRRDLGAHLTAPLPGADFAAWVGSWGFLPYFFTLPLVSFFFPDGRLASRRWLPVVALVIGLAAILTVIAMLMTPTVDGASQVANPYALQAPPWFPNVMKFGTTASFVIGFTLGALNIVLRLRRSAGVERAQLQWLLLGSLMLPLSLLIPGELGLILAVLGPPLGIAIAMLRHKLFDVELILNRTIVYAVLSVVVIAVYAGIVFGVQVVAPASTLGVLLVAGTALLAAVGRGAVQRLVDRLLFGERRDPYAVVARVGRHVAAASEPVEALQRLVDALRESLRLPYVGYVGPAGEPTVQAGLPVAGVHVIPACALGQQVGELRLGPRPGAPRWIPQEQAAVEEVAARAASLGYAARLVADVARSRERIVLAREEERRRLRADLHDGLGPALAGIAHQLDALGRRIETAGDPEPAARAQDLGDRLRSTVAQVRSVVHGLCPPVLDQVGLAVAPRQLVAGYDTPRCRARIGELGDMPAGIEVAAYAIAAEAVANAVRHSGASRIDLSADVHDGSLVVEVRDNGCGMPARTAAGVGLHSMSERAAEVGGRLDLLTAPGSGTVVRAELMVGHGAASIDPPPAGRAHGPELADGRSPRKGSRKLLGPPGGGWGSPDVGND